MSSPQYTKINLIQYLRLLISELHGINYHDKISKVSMSLFKKIKELIRFSTKEKVKEQLDPERFNLFDFGVEVAKNFESEARNKSLVYRAEIDDLLKHFTLSFDKVRLKQILEALLHNAIVFSEKGSVGLEISYFKFNSGNVEIDFIVKTAGVIIEKDDSSLQFKKSRLNGVAHGKAPTVDTNLLLAQTNIALMDSVLYITDLKEDGAQIAFRLSIPVIEYKEPIHKTGKKILIVEDNESNMTLLKIILKEGLKSVDIIEAYNGEEGVDQFIKTAPDFVIMDLRLPNMHGIEATRYIRSLENNQTPVVILSADKRENFLDECKELDIIKFLEKPLEEEELMEILQVHLPKVF